MKKPRERDERSGEREWEENKPEEKETDLRGIGVRIERSRGFTKGEKGEAWFKINEEEKKGITLFEKDRAWWREKDGEAPRKETNSVGTVGTVGTEGTEGETGDMMNWRFVGKE